MNSKHLKGLTVISIADGEKVGTIDRVYFDMESRRVVGFELQHGGILPALNDGGHSEFIAAEDVHALGPDAMTLRDRTALRDRARLESLIELDDLLRHKVVTDGGTYVGQVVSAEIDPETFEMQRLEVSPGFFKSHVEVGADQLLNTGPELIVVAESVLAQPGERASSRAAEGQAPDDGQITPAT